MPRHGRLPAAARQLHPGGAALVRATHRETRTHHRRPAVGEVSATDLHRRQRGLDREHSEDFFDTHSADEDARDDGAGERNEDYEDAVLGAVVAVTIDELTLEIDTLAGLSERARGLVESGRESKFETLREVVEDTRYIGEKWLIFSEHRDTADYLVRRLEGLGFSGHIAQIHGGLDWANGKSRPSASGGRTAHASLVATDAAARASTSNSAGSW